MQVSIKLRPKWDILRLTDSYPSLTITDWCNFDTDFYQLRTDDGSEMMPASRAFLALRKELGFTLQKKIDAADNSSIYVMSCAHSRRGSIEQIMQKHSCMPLMPLIYRNGWLEIGGVCLDEDRLPAMFKRLGRIGELEVARKSRVDSDLLRESLMIPTGSLVSSITKKQAESLLAAVGYGYYAVPRRVRFEDISEAVSMPRTTFEEHVRKAEGKVMSAVAPYLAVYFGSQSVEEPIGRSR